MTRSVELLQEVGYSVSMYEVVLALLLSHSAPGAVPAEQLATEILRVSNQYSLNPVQVAQLVMTESRGLASAYNARTRDTGLMQIHDTTAYAYGADDACLKVWRCNLAIGAKVLSELNRLCRYNVGTGPLVGARLRRCEAYEQKVASFN